MANLAFYDYLHKQEEDYIQESKIYLTKFEEHSFEILIGKTISKVIIKALYYETKLTKEYFNKILRRKKDYSLVEIYNEIINSLGK